MKRPLPDSGFATSLLRRSPLPCRDRESDDDGRSAVGARHPYLLRNDRHWDNAHTTGRANDLFPGRILRLAKHDTIRV
jgi:hypothetical protein